MYILKRLFFSISLNNGIRNIHLDFKEELDYIILLFLSGSVLGDWAVTITNVTNSSALVSWSPPPSSFVGGATVERYLLIGDQASREIYHPTWLSASQSTHLVENLLARTNYTGIIVAILSNGKRGSTDWKSFQTKEGSEWLVLH